MCFFLVKLNPFLSGRTLSAEPQPQCRGRWCKFILYTADMFLVVETRLWAMRIFNSLAGTVESPRSRTAITASHRIDLVIIARWCQYWVMKLNATKTKTMVDSHYRIIARRFQGRSLNYVVFIFRIQSIVNPGCESTLNAWDEHIWNGCLVFVSYDRYLQARLNVLR